MAKSKLEKIDKLATDIAWEVDGLLDGDERALFVLGVGSKSRQS